MKASSLAAALSAAALTAMLSAVPAQAAASDAVCFSGGRTLNANGTYKVNAGGCDGYSGTTVTIRFGYAAGDYKCGWTFLWNSQLGADNCVIT
ncbi:hypothetical protein ACIBEJ_16470 [Nonomuraea sp. NPDC050790]|uniref:hypothetical protein n=1 Tax=Nonomuraea sp. NPDC050790 TaxID=3364371 RepID=UPI0037ADB005